MLGKSIHHVVVSTAVYLGFSGGALYGQDCPFPDSVAVTDTLAAEGYFPLHDGDTWEYKVTDSAFIEEFRRTRVESDTLIEGLIFYKAILTRFNWNPEQSAIDRIKSRRSTYIRTTETGLMSWSPGQGFSEQLQGFDRPFN